MSSDLHSNSKSSFHSHLMRISVYFNLPDFNPNLLDTAIVKTFVRLMKQKHISYWKNTLQHSQKLVYNFIDLLKTSTPFLII